MTLEELKRDMELMGEKSFRAKQLYEWMHRRLSRSFDEMTNIPVSLRENAGRGMSIRLCGWQTSRNRP